MPTFEDGTTLVFNFLSADTGEVIKIPLESDYNN